MKARTIVHLDADSISGTALRCDHPDDKVSFRIVDGETPVWVTGTSDDFRRLANNMSRLAGRVVFEPTQFRSPDQDVTS